MISSHDALWHATLQGLGLEVVLGFLLGVRVNGLGFLLGFRAMGLGLKRT